VRGWGLGDRRFRTFEKGKSKTRIKEGWLGATGEKGFLTKVLDRTGFRLLGSSAKVVRGKKTQAGRNTQANVPLTQPTRF